MSTHDGFESIQLNEQYQGEEEDQQTLVLIEKKILVLPEFEEIERSESRRTITAIKLVDQ